MAKVVVGLSGGVDSSVAAQILVEQGHEVIGLFMRNWHDESVTLHDECPWIEDSNDALLVAEKLSIPFQVVDLSEEYKERIVDYMFAEYKAGRTPNPDVLCNREIKFDSFLKIALNLGADYVATGHYCRKDSIHKDAKTIHRLLAGKDKNKDQSYFLCQLNQEQLSKAIFPIGELQKSEVRKIALENELVTAEKKDSQGLCFIGKVRLPDFLQQQLKPKKGEIIEIPQSGEWEGKRASSNIEYENLSQPFRFDPNDGKKVGEHNGAHYFTIGQRKGLAVGGTPEPLFVLATDTTNNVIYTGQGENHKALSKKGLFIKSVDIHWLRNDFELKDGDSEEFLVRIRYRQELVKATLYKEKQGLYIIFEKEQKAITPGQFAAWYKGDELMGSGVIDY
tara:strand:+ start:112117 stop:113295 length:1179 start_codon:yes stop_codon:yes gene_type:complete